MRRAARLAIAAAALASATLGEAAARDQCLTRAETTALVSVVLPDVATVLGARCAPSLPSDATLRAGLAPLVARWRLEATASRPLAAGALAKITGQRDGPVDGDAVLWAIGHKTRRDVIKSVSPATCVFADEMLTLLAPLPSVNLSGLAVLILRQIGGAHGEGSPGNGICPDGRP